jgi:hypothetical protein
LPVILRSAQNDRVLHRSSKWLDNSKAIRLF